MHLNSDIAMNKVSTLSVLQWNCRSLQRRLPDLHYLLEENKINVAALCKTRLGDNYRPTFANYELLSKDRDRRGGGVALLVDRSLRVSEINNNLIEQLCSRNGIKYILDKVWVGVNNHIYICSIYSPRSGGGLFTEPQAWQELLRLCSSYDPIILCGDVNGKSPLWCSQLQWPDTEGAKLELAITNSDLFCLNDGSMTWSSADLSSSSALDVTIASPSLYRRCNWQILDSNFGSDHYPIIINISNVSFENFFGRPSFSVVKMCWDIFHKECVDMIAEFRINSNDLGSSYNNLISNIHNALLLSGAVRHDYSKPLRKAPSPWWDKECSELIQS